MALYIVVNPKTKNANWWDDDGLSLLSFRANQLTLDRCKEAQNDFHWVYAHRVGSENEGTIITCKALIDEADYESGIVNLREHVILNLAPYSERGDIRGKHWYEAPNVDRPSFMIVMKPGSFASVFVRSSSGRIAKVQNDGKGIDLVGEDIEGVLNSHAFWNRYEAMDHLSELESNGGLPQGFRNSFQGMIEADHDDAWPDF